MYIRDEFLFFNRKKHLGGGITLDVGVYTIQFCQMVFQQEPKSIKVTGEVNDEGVDVEVNAEVSYGDNKVAKMRTSSINTFKNGAKITGTKGTLMVRAKTIFIRKVIRYIHT